MINIIGFLTLEVMVFAFITEKIFLFDKGLGYAFVAYLVYKYSIKIYRSYIEYKRLIKQREMEQELMNTFKDFDLKVLTKDEETKEEE